MREINMEKRQKLENTQKVPIVVPKVAFNEDNRFPFYDSSVHQ